MFRGSGFGEPEKEESRDIGHLVLRKLHGVIVGIVQDTETFTSRAGR